MPTNNSGQNDNNLEGEFLLGNFNQKPNSDQNQDQTVNIQKNQGTNNTYSLKTGQKVGPFTTLMAYPQGVTFENQEADETIVLLIRRDFVTNFLWIFETILFAITPTFILPLLHIGFPELNLLALTQIHFVVFYYIIII